MHTVDIVLAQALIEHGMLSSLAETIQRTSSAVEEYLGGVDARVAVGLLIVLMIVLFRRR